MVPHSLSRDLVNWDSPSQADVAQLVEQPIRNRQVSGSSPLVGSILNLFEKSVHVSSLGFLDLPTKAKVNLSYDKR
jgi:hypothetical protein